MEVDDSVYENDKCKQRKEIASMCSGAMYSTLLPLNGHCHRHGFAVIDSKNRLLPQQAVWVAVFKRFNLNADTSKLPSFIVNWSSFVSY